MLDVIVVGGGAIGLCVARELSRRGKQVFVLEKMIRCGMGTSSRSSEVIHRGLYYPKTSLKSKFCLRGRNLLLQYLSAKNISHNLCGKLIVAPASKANDESNLRDIFDFGISLGFSDLRWLTAKDAEKLEPQVECAAAIFSPNTGIFDSHSVMNHLTEDIQNSSSESSIVNNCEYLSAKRLPFTDGFIVETSHGSVEARNIILAPGLFTFDAISTVCNFPLHILPTSKFAKGYYFKLRVNDGSKRPFDHLVYPLPELGGLGIHSTLNLAGEVRFGPNVEWISRSSAAKFPDYSFPDDPTILETSFRESIAHYWPGISNSERYSLLPDYCGIRPKIDSPGKYSDFVVLSESQHRIKGLICLMGIESPGWTSSFAIAEHVADFVE